MPRVCYFNKFGVSGHGKTQTALTAAAILCSATENEWHIKSFGDPLKEMVSRLYDFPLALAYSSVGKRVVPYANEPFLTLGALPYPVAESELDEINKVLREKATFSYTIGDLIDLVGNIFRQINADYWILALEQQIKTDEYVVINDVRHPNEIDWIRQNFGIVFDAPRYGPEKVFPLHEDLSRLINKYLGPKSY